MQKLPREAVSSNIDDRTMHEFYLWCVVPFIIIVISFAQYMSY